MRISKKAQGKETLPACYNEKSILGRNWLRTCPTGNTSAIRPEEQVVPMEFVDGKEKVDYNSGVGNRGLEHGRP